ncbi:DUF1102 domain-containing protein [Halorubrum sp. ASP121]|uniref:DUF1102 domain-containing protein n=1 Tax=Halorubrum sp. ASP121 TaxID=1855858 RepID=UPI0010F5ADA4|nr:DUF1102 domain-containing protein [Halorubrum sp. ASP121]TKX50455.1 DUF1102 domain-containing protein [Halorubrum sp. ASP121]
MERRKFVIGMGSLAAGGAAAMGTGAVSQFNSGDRTIEVETVGDASAYIALQRPNDGLSDSGGTRNGNFVKYSNEKLRLDFTSNNSTSANGGDPQDSSPNGGDGVNPDSTYYFDGTFEIRNLSNNSGGGVGEMEIWINENIDGITFYTGSSAGNRTPLNSNNRASTSPGQAVSVGVKIVQENLTSGDIDESFEVVAQENGNGL